MTKREMVTLKVKHDIWKLFSKVYNLSSTTPQSEKQEELLTEIGNYLSDKLCDKLSREDLEEILK
jgi:hypothetical protein